MIWQHSAHHLHLHLSYIYTYVQGVFSQHSADQLDLNLSPIEYMQKKFPGKYKDMQDWRTAVGRFGVTGASMLL